MDEAAERRREARAMAAKDDDEGKEKDEESRTWKETCAWSVFGRRGMG